MRIENECNSGFNNSKAHHDPLQHTPIPPQRHHHSRIRHPPPLWRSSTHRRRRSSHRSPQLLFTTKAELKLVIAGSHNYRLDPARAGLLNKDGRPTYYYYSKAICEGLETVTSRLARAAGITYLLEVTHSHLCSLMEPAYHQEGSRT